MLIKYTAFDDDTVICGIEQAVEAGAASFSEGDGIVERIIHNHTELASMLSRLLVTLNEKSLLDDRDVVKILGAVFSLSDGKAEAAE